MAWPALWSPASGRCTRPLDLLYFVALFKSELLTFCIAEKGPNAAANSNMQFRWDSLFGGKAEFFAGGILEGKPRPG